MVSHLGTKAEIYANFGFQHHFFLKKTIAFLYNVMFSDYNDSMVNMLL